MARSALGPVRNFLYAQEGHRRHFGVNTACSYSYSFSTDVQQSGAPHAHNSQFPVPSGEIGGGNELLFKSISLSNNQAQCNGRNVPLLSQQVAFLFSDLNLRNNEYARSILRDNQSLPLSNLLTIKSVKEHTRDATDPSAAVIDAINHFNKSGAKSSLSQSLMHLHVEESDVGDTVVRRSPPFCYLESIRNSHRKMMVVEGWPKDKKARPKRAMGQIRSLICNRDMGDIPMAFYRYDYDSGVISIEFESEDGAECAWENLNRAALQVDGTHGINVKNISSETQNNYQFKLGELLLVARSVGIPIIGEKSLPDPDATTDKAADTTASDYEQCNPAYSPYEPFYATVPNWVNWAAETPTLSQFTDAMNFLYQEHFNTTDDSRRQQICRGVVRLVSSAKSSIKQGKIKVDGFALTDSFSLAMLLYSKSQPSAHGASKDGGLSDSAVSPYEACLDIIGILRSLNLDILPTHYTCAIRAACNESRWSDGTMLFFSQIDGNDTDNAGYMATGGFTPIDAALAWEGLYAVAMKIAEDVEAGKMNVSPSKYVFDTAMKMCMISPSGQERYILAAGKALGRAGLWKDCVDYATDSMSISSYGPSIVAAAMLACTACSRHDDAIDVYDFFITGNRSTASEWQWGGGDITAIKPLCRDLALCAMGNYKKGGLSRRAMSLFAEIIYDGHPVSRTALLSLAHSMELDGDWRSSFNFLKAFSRESPSWQVVSELGTTNYEIINAREKEDLLAGLLASVMRVCNSGGQHGLAILARTIAFSEQKTKMNDLDNRGIIVKSARSQKKVSDNPQISEAPIQSHGAHANELLNEFQSGFSAPRRFRQNDSTHQESSINAYAAIDRVLKAMDVVRSEGEIFSLESRFLFERGLTRAMEHLIDSGQSAAALELFVHVNAFLIKKDESLTERVRTFLGMDHSYGDNIEGGELFQSAEINIKQLTLNDPLLAAIINAYNKLGQSQKARSAFDDGTLHSDDSKLLTQSSNNTLEAMLGIDIYEGLRFIKAMDAKCINPSTFFMVARQFARKGIWHEIGEVYNNARSVGCISEDLGLIAMQAVCESELLVGKITTLRRIVDDVSGLSLMKSNDWIKSRYWTIRKNVGFHYARLLMRWDDPATSSKEELLFAVNEMRQCATEGIVVKNGPLMCIVSIADLYCSDDSRRNKSDMSERQRRSSVNLILEACAEARQSGFIKNHAFTAKAVRSLRALKANKECVQIVSALISDGSNCRHRIAMEEAIYAASEENDHVSFQLITDAFEKSGHNSSRLSI